MLVLKNVCVEKKRICSILNFEISFKFLLNYEIRLLSNMYGE